MRAVIHRFYPTVIWLYLVPLAWLSFVALMAWRRLGEVVYQPAAGRFEQVGGAEVALASTLVIGTLVVVIGGRLVVAHQLLAYHRARAGGSLADPPSSLVAAGRAAPSLLAAGYVRLVAVGGLPLLLWGLLPMTADAGAPVLVMVWLGVVVAGWLLALAWARLSLVWVVSVDRPHGGLPLVSSWRLTAGYAHRLLGWLLVLGVITVLIVSLATGWLAALEGVVDSAAGAAPTGPGGGVRLGSLLPPGPVMVAILIFELPVVAAAQATQLSGQAAWYVHALERVGRPGSAS